MRVADRHDRHAVGRPVAYDYAILRVVPRVDRGEFLNAGVIVSCVARRLLRAAVELDPARVLALDPDADVDDFMNALAAIPLICAGGPAAGALGLLSARERFDWLVAPRSASIQTSPVHTGLSVAPEAMVERLMDRVVRPPRRVDQAGP